jgi:hypothetical protein
VLLSTWGSRGDVEPLAGLAVRLRELGAEVRVCAPPDEEFMALPTTGLMPAAARSVAEKLGIRYVFACFHPFGLPSQHFPPQSRPGRPSPGEETDLKVLWEQDVRRVNELYGEAENSHLDLVQTGAWILPDERPLPEGLEAFLVAGAPPVYVGFGSRAAACSLPAAGPTWPRSTTSMTVSSSARSTSGRCSAGWPPSCATAARAPRRRPPGPARPRWSYREGRGRHDPHRRGDRATVAAKLLLDMIGMTGMTGMTDVAGMAGMTGREKPRMSA